MITLLYIYNIYININIIDMNIIDSNDSNDTVHVTKHNNIKKGQIKKNKDFLTKNIPKLAFLFVIFIVIAGGSIRHVLSCQMQRTLEHSFIFKHILGVLLIFLFIMLETGGWDFDENELDKADNNWDAGNTFHSLIFAFIIYGIFLLSSKSHLLPNIVFYSALFLVYIISSYRSYLQNRNNISEENNKKAIILERVLLLISLLTLIYGFIEYFFYKKNEFGKQFSLFKFIFSNNTCSYERHNNYKV